MKKKAFRRVFLDTVPVLTGYLILGMFLLQLVF